MLRPAQPGDAPAIEGFLSQRPDTTMFLRGNLRDHGPCGGTASHATRMWLWEPNGQIAGVLGLSTAGFAMVEMPTEAIATHVPGLWADETVNGITGGAAMANALRRALGLATAPARRDEDEPHYALNLDDLVIPAGDTTLRLATPDDAAQLSVWRAHYIEELFAAPPDQARIDGAKDIARLTAQGRLAVLEKGITLVAMTAFNAALPDIVQVGNVYTPPDARGRGLARRAVALHLAMARSSGAKRAVLSAASTSAARAYEAIGFRRIGDYTLLIFDGPQSPRDPA